MNYFLQTLSSQIGSRLLKQYLRKSEKIPVIFVVKDLYVTWLKGQ